MESPGRRSGGMPSPRTQERRAKRQKAHGKKIQGQQDWNTRDRACGSPSKRGSGSTSSAATALTTSANGNGDNDDDDDDTERVQAVPPAPGGLTVRSATDTHLIAANRPSRLRNGLLSG